jgi:hypothetical protein
VSASEHRLFGYDTTWFIGSFGCAVIKSLGCAVIESFAALSLDHSIMTE